MYHETKVIGNLGQDAEVREAGNGNTVINFSVAATDTWKDKQGQKQSKTTWYRCEYWTNNTGISPYLTKGTMVLVIGRSKANSYTNQQGEVVTQEGINVQRVQLLGSGSGKSNTSQSKENSGSKYDPEQHNDLPFKGGEGDLEF